MSAESQPHAGICFNEEMAGFLAPGVNKFEDGYRLGQERHDIFMFHLTIQCNDLAVFLSDASHQAHAFGYVRGALVGGQRALSQGDFNLFVVNPATGCREMHYRLFFENGQGEPFTLAGLKIIHGWPLPRILHDATTLYTTLYRGHVAPGQEAGAAVFATGILRIGLFGTLCLLFSMRASAPGWPGRIGAIWRFARFFMGSLWRS